MFSSQTDPTRPAQRPLDATERERIWRWERTMVRFYTLAMVVLAVCALVLWGYSTERWARLSVAGAVSLLALVAGWVQFRERCPRCNTLLGRQSRLMLPLRCKVCKVEFPREKDHGKLL